MLTRESDFYKNLSVLFVDDDADISEELEMLLSTYFKNVYVAHNGLEGIEQFKLHRPDIVLTDIQMPKMDGLTMLQSLREISTETPVVVSSAFSDFKYLKVAIEMGVSNYILKPVDFESLMQALDKIVENLHNKYQLELKQRELEDLNEKLEKQTRKAENFSKAKSEFLANMSHEIRTPLNAIMGFIALLKDKSKSQNSEDYIEIIDRSSQSLLKIIEDILDFSKIESGKLSIDRIDFKTKDEFTMITYLFNAKCLENEIELSLVFGGGLPEIIHADPLRIKQVISNLLSNAIKFTSKHKKIEVHIDFKEGNLEVSVKDEGKGIAKDKLEHIFEAFQQEDGSTTRIFGGTGLGLSISRELVKLMGGELKIRSELGSGSEFYFSIPVGLGIEAIDSDAEAETVSLKGKKILLVEDNRSNQMLMKILLDDMGASHDLAKDGLEAVEKYTLHTYDLILMDENMPHMGGIEATQEIIAYEQKKNKKHTPIVALTANGLKGDKERFLAAGMDDYLSKPIDMRRLAEVLKKFLHP